MNHHGLFIKLMEKSIPTNVLTLLENWYTFGCTCVKWGSNFSNFFGLRCGVRQGGVLSPYLFAIYIDSVVVKIKQEQSIGCYINYECVSILLYADDIILLAPSVTALQQLLRICERELDWLDMAINARKSACLRIGPRHNAECECITTIDGRELQWVNSLRYLGVYLVNSNAFACNFDSSKRSFYRSFNAIFGKIGRVASEEVVVHLVKAKCLPMLLYGLDVCPLNSKQVKSLDYVLYCAFRKIFNICSTETVESCMAAFNFPTIATAVWNRKRTFLTKYSCHLDNTLCQLFSDSAIKERSFLL